MRRCAFRFLSTLLDELVAGVTMDLDSAHADAPDTYATFDGSYIEYCYLVASVVGLVCIRIFGYSGPAGGKTGRGDGDCFPVDQHSARRGGGCGAQPRLSAAGGFGGAWGCAAELLQRNKDAGPTANERALLREIGQRAERYYASAQALMPLIDRESRPALWVLVAIYHALLKRIESAEFDVFSRRASVPLAEKLAILVVGLLKMGWVRMVG